MSQTHQKTCFISAPFGFDALPLMLALAEKNVASSRLDISEPYEDIISAVKREIKKADFVCTVLPTGYQLDNMILETGIALGINRPLLLLTDPDVSVPFDLQSLRRVTTKLNEKRAIASVLGEYLSDLTTGTRPRKPKPRRKLQTLSEDDIAGISTILRHPQALTEIQLVETLSDLFKKVGILHVVSPAADQRAADSGADLALWIDETQSVIGNPILVEVKAGRISQSKIDMTFHHVSNYLIATGLQLGLLVYLDTAGRTFKVPSTRLPLVICISFAQLVDELRRGTLPSTLLDIRNKAAHGMAS